MNADNVFFLWRHMSSCFVWQELLITCATWFHSSLRMYTSQRLLCLHIFINKWLLLPLCFNCVLTVRLQRVWICCHQPFTQVCLLPVLLGASVMWHRWFKGNGAFTWTSAFKSRWRLLRAEQKPTVTHATCSGINTKASCQQASCQREMWSTCVDLTGFLCSKLTRGITASCLKRRHSRLLHEYWTLSASWTEIPHHRSWGGPTFILQVQANNGSVRKKCVSCSVLLSSCHTTQEEVCPSLMGGPMKDGTCNQSNHHHWWRLYQNVAFWCWVLWNVMVKQTKTNKQKKNIAWNRGAKWWTQMSQVSRVPFLLHPLLILFRNIRTQSFQTVSDYYLDKLFRLCALSGFSWKKKYCGLWLAQRVTHVSTTQPVIGINISAAACSRWERKSCFDCD